MQGSWTYRQTPSAWTTVDHLHDDIWFAGDSAVDLSPHFHTTLHAGPAVSTWIYFMCMGLHQPSGCG